MLRPAIELFVGVPSIVYGYIGLILLVPRLQPFAPPGGAGYGFGAAAIVLGVMVVPTIATLSADSLQALPPTLREGSIALGATPWQTLWRVLIPAARPGIISGVVLGFARAMGEALAVALVIGNVAQMPQFQQGLKLPLRAGHDHDHDHHRRHQQPRRQPQGQAARYMLALVLLVITFGCVTVVRVVQRRSSGDHVNRRARLTNAVAFWTIRVIAAVFLGLVVFVLLYTVFQGRRSCARRLLHRLADHRQRRGAAPVRRSSTPSTC